MDEPPSLGLGVEFADAAFEGLQVTYDLVRLDLVEFSGRRVHLDCEGWIALSLGPFFDDSFTTAGRLLRDDPRITAARDAVAGRGDSGSPARNLRQYLLLEVDLDDGARLECVAASVGVTFPDI